MLISNFNNFRYRLGMCIQISLSINVILCFLQVLVSFGVVFHEIHSSSGHSDGLMWDPHLGYIPIDNYALHAVHDIDPLGWPCLLVECHSLSSGKIHPISNHFDCLKWGPHFVYTYKETEMVIHCCTGDP